MSSRGRDRLGVVERSQQRVARVGLRVLHPLRVKRHDAGLGEGAQDAVADVARVLGLLDPGVDREQVGVAVRREEGAELVDLLLVLHQALVERRGGAESQVAEHVERRPLAARLAEGGRAERDTHPGQRRRRPRHVGHDRSLGRRLARHVHRVAPRLPGAPVLLDQREHLVGPHVARHDHGRVLGPVPAVEERLRVVELVGHVLDVLQETHAGVAIGVGPEGVVALHFDELLDRVGAVLVVLAEHGPRLGLERLYRVLEVLEAIGLDLQDRLEVLAREGRVVVGEVVAGEGVLASAGLGQDRLVRLGRERLRPPEHHVLEEVSEARLAGLHLVPRPGLDRDLERHDVREAGRDDDHAQAVRQRALLGVEGEDAARGAGALGGRGHGQSRSAEQNSNGLWNEHGTLHDSRGDRGSRRMAVPVHNQASSRTPFQ